MIRCKIQAHFEKFGDKGQKVREREREYERKKQRKKERMEVRESKFSIDKDIEKERR